MLTQKRLKEIIHYEPDTGVFTRHVTVANAVAGSIAGCKTSMGYIRIKIDRKAVFAHRLAWLYVYGYFPKQIIDHVNQIKDDNRIKNLRKSSALQNAHNISHKKTISKSGFRGVSWHKRCKKYCARIRVNNKTISLGYFNNPESAHKAYLEAAKKYHIA